MIPQRNLSLLSNRLAQEAGRRIPEGILEKDYCLSWFLIGLSNCPLKDILLFKGGTAIKKCYIPDYRFSQDLDFTLEEEVSFEHILNSLDIAFKHTQEVSGVALNFARRDRHTHENTYTFFLRYEGPLPTTSGKEVKVDITIRESIFFPVEGRLILKGYEEYEDLPEDTRIRVYSMLEIAAEKVVGLLDPARNEPRDLYDIWYLTSHGYVELAETVGAIKKKWDFRGRKPKNTAQLLRQKEARFRKLWQIRLSSQMVALPEYDKVYREVRRELRQANLLK